MYTPKVTFSNGVFHRNTDEGPIADHGTAAVGGDKGDPMPACLKSSLKHVNDDRGSTSGSGERVVVEEDNMHGFSLPLPSYGLQLFLSLEIA